MSKASKSLDRLCRKPTPADYRWDELCSVLDHLGFEQLKGAGSRRKFFHKDRNVLISLHEPHPSPEVPKYALDQVRETLQNNGFI